MTEQSKLTPMMRQYRAAKAQIPSDAVLLFRLGDFYEEFFEDAEKVSSALDLVLTRRQGVPMCGFPHHALENYLAKLVAQGMKVAIAEQMEDPREAKGIVKREITRIITPGTLIDNSLLNSKYNNFIACVIPSGEDKAALSVLDVSTGEFFYTVPEKLETITGELARIAAREIIVPAKAARVWREQDKMPDPGHKVLWTELDDSEFDFEECEDYLKQRFDTSTMDGFGMKDVPESVRASGALLRYAQENLRHNASYINTITRHTFERYLELDPISMRNLELVTSRSEGGKSGSLLNVIDRTSTSLGSRRLRSWLLRPLRDHAEIVARHDAVEQFTLDPLTLAELRETIGVIRDLERILARIGIGSANARDFVALAVSLDAMPGIRSLIESFDAALLARCAGVLADFSQLVERIKNTIVDEPPVQINEGGVIREGFSAELDELRQLSGSGKSMLADIQQREAERTGIKSLKVKFNNVFGYYIEVSKANLALIPEDYIRKQTLVNAERFVTPELKDLENRILGAEEKARALELKIFSDLREYAIQFTGDIQKSADALADIDAIASLAECARVNNYTRPNIFDDQRLVILGGRHPVLDAAMEPGAFVPNDVELGRQLRMMMITGPNMAGKSTYIRQNALLVILAQIGSFIPADYAEIGLVDRIFTRIGAGDDLSRNQSTFMVEMVETANILRNATSRSLVILDEIGRGTSTYDGLSIAWSVAEYLHDNAMCKTLFATHYHELSGLASFCAGIGNYNVAVKECGDRIIFLRQILPGPSDRSYGLHVARLAGVPAEVIERAQSILDLLEELPSASGDLLGELPRHISRPRKKKIPGPDDPMQLRLKI